jgi:hypothetical protein
MTTHGDLVKLYVSVPQIEPRFYAPISRALLGDDVLSAVERFPELKSRKGIDQVQSLVMPLLMAQEMELAGRAAALVKILEDIRSRDH